MTHAAAHPETAPQRGGVLCVCRDPRTRALLARYVPEARIHLSAVEALLSAARDRPSAVVLALEGGERSVGQVSSAFRRANQDVPICGVVEAAEEPLARSLVGTGLADYLVLPRDAARLPAVLAGAKQAVERPASGPPATVPRGLFEAACRLSDLAAAEPAALFCEGARLMLQAVGAARGSALVWSERDERLEAALAIDGDETLGADDPEPVRAAAARCLRTGERLSLPPGTPGAPPDGLTCVTVRDAESSVGVICWSGSSAVGGPADIDPADLEALASTLARLYRAAERRQAFAR